MIESLRLQGGYDMTGRLQGKTALVTGSTSGIGRAIAAAFAAEGAQVVVSGRDTPRGQQVVAKIRAAGGHAEFVAADLGGGAAAARALADEATRVLGGHVDVLVNNAGIFPGGPSADVDERTFDAVFALNVKAPFFLTSALAPRMAERGTGAVINTGSWVGTLALRGSALYGSSKAALELLTKAWSAEFGPAGVRINAVAPGLVRTDGDEARVERQNRLAQGTSAGRPGTPEEIASAVVYLASDEASFVHGAVFAIDGGRVAAVL
jgi:NAD(P)-dependent dehydrogenase (short-subunit alcohol dehydrogenase family)